MRFSKIQIKEQVVWLVFAVLIVSTAVNAVGYHHADEHYQIIEFANYFLGGIGGNTLSWEFQNQIRPSIQPLIAVGVISFSRFIDLPDPFDIMVVIRILTGFLALYAVVDFIKRVLRKDDCNFWFLGVVGAFGLWFLPYLMIRFSSENMASVFFLIGISRLLGVNKTNFLIAGILLGLSFCFRFQIGIAIAGLGAYLLFIRSIEWQELLRLSKGFLIVLVVLILSDRLFYGDWVFTPLNYVKLQLIEGKAASFGTDPWWKYFELLWIGLTPFLSIPAIIAFIVILIKNPKHPLFFVAIPFLVVHMLIGHKELRFLFPVLFCLPYLLYEFFLIVSDTIGNRITSGVVVTFLTVNAAGMIMMTQVPSGEGRLRLAERIHNEHPKDEVVLMYKNYSNPFEPWKGHHAAFYHNSMRNIQTREFVEFEELSTLNQSGSTTYYVMVREMDLQYHQVTVEELSEELILVDSSCSPKIKNLGIRLGLIKPLEIFYLFRMKSK